MAARILTQQVVGTSFAFYTDEEIKRLSVKRVTNPVTFDTYAHPTTE
jgi:DNA-directed RNA polymerase I subunit RPA1